MYPIIFTVNKYIQISTYGILLGLAFYLGFLLAEREFKLNNKDPELAYKLLLFVIPSAIIGAKLFHILEDPKTFLMNPSGVIFSGAGLSVLGGFLMSFLVAIAVIRKHNESVLKIFDISTPTMALGYAIGRLGCHVSGDGCYGIATTSIFGTPYPNGHTPTAQAVFPTPLFESFASFIIFVILMRLRKKEPKTGFMFFLYLIFLGVPRFSVEFIRTNPKILFSLTQAQFISIFLVITGIIGIIMINKKATGQISQ